MKKLTIEQKKKIDNIKIQMFKELKQYDDKQLNDFGNILDAGQGNPIISKYKKQIKEIINNDQEI